MIKAITIKISWINNAKTVALAKAQSPRREIYSFFNNKTSGTLRLCDKTSVSGAPSATSAMKTGSHTSEPSCKTVSSRRGTGNAGNAGNAGNVERISILFFDK